MATKKAEARPTCAILPPAVRAAVEKSARENARSLSAEVSFQLARAYGVAIPARASRFSCKECGEG